MKEFQRLLAIDKENMILEIFNSSLKWETLSCFLLSQLAQRNSENQRSLQIFIALPSFRRIDEFFAIIEGVKARLEEDSHRAVSV